MAHTPIKDIRGRTKDSILLIITVILLAFAIEILAFCLVVLTNENIIFLSISTLPFIILACVLFYRLFLPNESIKINLRGIIAYEFTDNEITPIEIYGYHFNKSFNSTLESLIPKNEKYIKIFNNEETIEKKYKYNPEIINRKDIINSILEYLVLYKLSMHLDAYYAKNEIDDKKIITITINEFDEDILKNKIFLEDMVFKDVIYEEGFEINLPMNSKIIRNTDGYLEINNKIFDITIVPDYQGYNENINPILTDYEDTHEPFPFYSIEIKLHIILKRYFLLNNDYMWLDSFLEEIKEFVCIERLNERLNTDLLSCFLKIIK